MEGRFATSASEQFIKLKGNLSKSLDGAIATHSSILKQKGLDQLESTKQAAISNAKEKVLGGGNPLKNICSVNYDELNRKVKKLIAKLEAMSRIINNIITNLERLQSYTALLEAAGIIFSLLVEVLTLLPIPTMFSTIGITNKMSSILQIIKTKATGFLYIVTGINIILSSVRFLLAGISAAITAFLSTLQLLVNQLNDCDDEKRKKLGEELQTAVNRLSYDNTNLIRLFTLDGDDINNGAISSDKTGSTLYKGYSFRIIEEEVTDKSIKIKRRRALALNKMGIVALEGTPSFATDTNILIEELKLRIDYEESINNKQQASNKQYPSSNLNSSGEVIPQEEDPSDLNLDTTFADISFPSKEELSKDHEAALKIISNSKSDSQKQMMKQLSEADRKWVNELSSVYGNPYKWDILKARNLYKGIQEGNIFVFDAKEQWRVFVDKYWGCYVWRGLNTKIDITRCVPPFAHNVTKSF